MKKCFISLITCIIFSLVAFSQGTIRGKITDENGEPVIGASIVLKAQPTIGAMSDFNGLYSLKISGLTPQTIVISYISYQKIEETINPKNGEIIIKDFNLVPVSVVLQDAVVIGKANKSKEVYMEKVKTNSVLSIDYISSETLKKTGDVNVSSAVARVTGVSTNGSFITVRGIGDRYMKTAINGSRIPTLDPFTNNIKLDLFPASLVDNIVITKTASPDLPGDWAGAYLSVETKDYPEKLSVNVETSFGYNDQATFKDVISSEQSATDWLGYDNGLRDINHNDFVPININPSTYDEFVALGLGNYYKKLGVSNDNWNLNSDTYTKLGLVQLGLLSVNQFTDSKAISNAETLYHNNYQKHADALINKAGVKSQARLFPNNWNTTTRKAPLNYSQSFSIGDQTTLFGKPLGYIAGFRYSSSMQYDPNSIGHKYGLAGHSNIGDMAYDTLIFKTGRQTNGWSALVNLAYKYNPNHSISLLFMPNLIGVNKVTNGWEYDQADFSASGDAGGLILNQHYEERRQLVYQLKSEHYLPGPKLKIELTASYTNGNSSNPDDKTRKSGAAYLDRIYSYLKEDLFDTRLSAELPLGIPNEAGIRKLKFGAAYQYNYKKSDQYDYTFNRKNTSIPFSGIVDSTLNLWYSDNGYYRDHNFGYSRVKAGYAMLDFPIIPVLRFSGGIRVEQAKMYTDVAYFDSLGLASGDIRRTEEGYIANPGSLNKVSFLPSANLIFKLKRDEMAPVNLRLNYSQTVARPSIREISSSRVYDYSLQCNVNGNPDLKIVQINNYDARIEAYFKSGDNISISAFYKNFKNHIELIVYDHNFTAFGATWKNASTTWLKGIEIEGKKNLTKKLELRANVTIVDSRSTINKYINNQIGGDTATHTMYDQAPYIINAILSYTSEKAGLSAAISYNIQGPRLVIVSNIPKTIPDIYELPRHLLDFKLSKSIGKHFTASFKMNDVLASVKFWKFKNLNTDIVRSYKFPEGYILDYDKYAYGTNYVFAILYKL